MCILNFRLVFSQSILSLDLIEEFLSYKNEEAMELQQNKKSKKVRDFDKVIQTSKMPCV